MKTQPNDGGPAIEMSLRDYFAGQALQSMGNNPATWDDIAKGCYLAADAMLAARERKEGDQ